MRVKSRLVVFLSAFPTDIRKSADQHLQAVADELPASEEQESLLELDESNECFLALEEPIVVMFYLDEEFESFILHLLLGPLQEGPSREQVMPLEVAGRQLPSNPQEARAKGARCLAS